MWCVNKQYINIKNIFMNKNKKNNKKVNTHAYVRKASRTTYSSSVVQGRSGLAGALAAAVEVPVLVLVTRKLAVLL